MTLQDLIAAMELPAGCRVDQRVPKKMLIENGALTATDKREINDGIEDTQWLAALKPNTIGVPDYRDDSREYVEIAVLGITLRGDARSARLAQLVHRAVPYPVVLILSAERSVSCSFAHKRSARNEAEKVVLDGSIEEVCFVPAESAASASIESAFLQALALRHQPQSSLLALYQGWIDKVQALLAARLTGAFVAPSTQAQALARRQALQDCHRLQTEIGSLRTQAAREKQVARQVNLNLHLKKMQMQLAEALQQL